VLRREKKGTLLRRHISIIANPNYYCSSDEHADFESLARNRISNISFAVCSAGEILILAVMVGIVKALHAEDSAENNTKAFSVLTAFSGGVWRTSFLLNLRSSIKML
jgi:hypothetical protein